MKIISKSSINRDEAILLFSTQSGSELHRIGIDRYAIYKTTTADPIIAFESLSFSYLIDPLDNGISDIAVIGCNCTMCEDTHLFIEIRILLPDGTSYYMDSNDNAVAVTNVELADLDDSPAPTACKHWKLPRISPYQHMLVTNALTKRINVLCKTTIVTDIIQRMWLESKQLMCPLLFNRIVHIRGEFFDYHVKELRCGRKLFMIGDEVATYSKNHYQI